jgi:hypothetical protein
MTRKVSTVARDKTNVRVRVVARMVTTVAKAKTRARAREVARRPIAAAKARTGAHCKASSLNRSQILSAYVGRPGPPLRSGPGDILIGPFISPVGV